MSARDDRFWEERMAVRYLDALDSGDLDTDCGTLGGGGGRPGAWRDLLDEVNRGPWKPRRVREPTSRPMPTRVIELARRHLPSAFPVEMPTGPVIAADVARRLEAEPEFRRLDPADRASHARLLADSTPLPGSLGQAGGRPMVWRDLGSSLGRPIARRSVRWPSSWRWP